MTASERQFSILEILEERRFETVDNLAFEFNVSRRTIRYDIETLSLHFPLYTKSGGNGGVYVMDGESIFRRCLSKKRDIV